MNEENTDSAEIDRQIARRLKTLRTERGWSLDELALRSGVSRASLSRLEKAGVSATASVLGKLCAAYGLTLSRLMRQIEPVWSDPAQGFVRRSVSPPDRNLAGEVLECELAPGTTIAYDAPPRAGLEHHLVMRQGELELTLDGQLHTLGAGDCLRYQLFGSSRFAVTAPFPARYLLFIV
jgi:transcriptional regulator with XRE-family HTH domain